MWVTLTNAAPEAKENRSGSGVGRRAGSLLFGDFFGKFSKEADGAKRSESVFHRVCAEELAMYALEDTHSASQLRNCLLNAKLYDKRSQSFMKRKLLEEFNTRQRDVVKVDGLSRTHARNGWEEFWTVDIMGEERPTELGLELLFYDSRTGEVWVPHVPEEDGEEPLTEKLPRKRDFLSEMLN